MKSYHFNLYNFFFFLVEILVVFVLMPNSCLMLKFFFFFFAENFRALCTGTGVLLTHVMR
jgi:hypothetical protein